MKTIGQNSTRLVTKQELIEAIEEQFEERGNVAVITNVWFGEYENRLHSQTITLGKPLEF